MKKIIFCLSMLALICCNTPANKTQVLQNRIDSLENKLNQMYKPGLGEFMSSIQVHHAKLWFAGENQNWDLANFEIGEIKEALDDIPVYCSDRPEVKKLSMINQPIDSVIRAINAKNAQSFKNDFGILTATCNNCHQATNHAFNVIKIPDNTPFSNQDFKKHTAE